MVLFENLFPTKLENVANVSWDILATNRMAEQKINKYK